MVGLMSFAKPQRHFANSLRTDTHATETSNPSALDQIQKTQDNFSADPWSVSGQNWFGAFSSISLNPRSDLFRLCR